MLYLTRKIDESIIINNDINITIIEINKNSVKLGIETPKSSTVLRKEVHDVIVKENMEALLSFDENSDKKVEQDDINE
ncbi:carbon storage regulator CsrA [Rickettsiales endosymbiont of Trichoplax sp. H2]|uniref:carbon storage regulator CsrA n=1 Tax=Rickettsiales endosymbiont of Trichoplax sp. H2 TaxID=2021221 RepID=UPI0012B2B9F8|nr:carbon storage regulator CsrA [Rickettsiales endosymbiont of Trichoplax sp. H2]MSO14110.1 Carbon storage regulator-like protein [Rickettsiales endosymbiont of Trichoplax sp. H2]